MHESEPLIEESGSHCLTLDGRIDNRDELSAALGPHRRQLRYDTDAEPAGWFLRLAVRDRSRRDHIGLVLAAVAPSRRFWNGASRWPGGESSA